MYLNFGGPPGSRLDRAVRPLLCVPACVSVPVSGAQPSRVPGATVHLYTVRDQSPWLSRPAPGSVSLCQKCTFSINLGRPWRVPVKLRAPEAVALPSTLSRPTVFSYTR